MKKENKLNRDIYLDRVYEDEDIIIHFVGDRSSDEYFEIKIHTNPGYEICLIPRGKGFFKIFDTTYPISAGQMFITKEQQIHAGWPAKEYPFRILYICFNFKNNIQDGIWKDVRQKIEGIEFPIANDILKLDDIYIRIINETLKKELYSEEIIFACFKQLILLTIRNYLRKAMMDVNSAAEEKQILAMKIMRFIDDNVNEDISLNKISSFFNYSISYICEAFKNQTGFTVMEYLSFSRLEHAKAMLVKSNENITVISEKCGYSSIHHFSKSFKSIYGISPKQYRNQLYEVKPNTEL